jgi:putative DNA primase/helicase
VSGGSATNSQPPLARRPDGRIDLDLVEAAFAVGAGLPVTELVVSGDPATARAAAAALWMARLWGDRPGYACLCLGLDGHLSQNGSYEFDRFIQSFHRWPAGRRRLLAQAMAAADQADVYAGVLLRSGPSRRAGTAQAGRVAWADVDGPWTTQRAQALDRLGGWPTWQVHSGSGRHLYLPLRELEPPTRLEGWNRRLAVLLAADSGWSETKLLRLPGTYNHKPRARGGQSIPVAWLS